MPRVRFIVLLISGLAGSIPVRATDPVNFNRDVRPILSDKCFACHGPDENKREAKLRLDTFDSALAARRGGAAIVPGRPENSGVMKRIASTDPDEVMPPPESQKTLTEDQKATIRRWIEQGAKYEGHWAWTAPRRLPPPRVVNEAWVRNEIDAFVMHRLEHEGLQPTGEADKAVLIRRLSLDLTGLPPTPAEVDAFLRDGSGDAYEKLVDRLLASPRFGEHRARYWLDQVRYGDTHGLHLDNYREIWPYRQWVIEALNRNLPFDQFVVEQLAGDLLENPTVQQRIASGYNRCNLSTSEGGAIAEECYVRNTVDRVETAGSVFLGLTVGCAVCHDHKYDPITQKDFYQLFALFNSLDENPLDGNRKDHAPVLRVVSEEQQRRLADLDGLLARTQQALTVPIPAVDEAQRRWETGIVRPDQDSAQTVSAQKIELGDWHTAGPFPERDGLQAFRRKYAVERLKGAPDLTRPLREGENQSAWTRRSDWVDGKVHADLPGVWAANFLYRTITVAAARKAVLKLGSDDAVKVFLNGGELLAQDVRRAAAADQETIELPLKAGENHLLLKIVNHEGASGFYFSLQDADAAPPPDVLALARIEPGDRTAEQAATIRDYYRTRISDDPGLAAGRSELARLRLERNEIERDIPTTMVSQELPEPKPAHILIRGQYDQKGPLVGRDTPAALMPMDPSLPRNRLGFARWLVDPRHPLTARVAVNRLWQQFFGVGLVKTSEDFGLQGEWPSHPELLDWLATRFIDDGWDVKRFIRRVVGSATYRQSSRAPASLYARDPENRLLARGPRFRLDAEALRDQALLLGGLLVERIGGPSVKPPQPAGLWEAVGYTASNTANFTPDAGPNIHRRSLYTFWKRTSAPPQMTTLDAPSRESCVVRRERTNTPLQALLLLNEEQFVESARHLAQRAMTEGGHDAASRLAWMFRAAACRLPDPIEAAELAALHRDQLARFRADPTAAAKLIRTGSTAPPASLDPAELAAWTMLANTILNLDEVVTKG